ncbi:unnamed protein product [Cunninghamella blakesleeana]
MDHLNYLFTLHSKYIPLTGENYSENAVVKILKEVKANSSIKSPHALNIVCKFIMDVFLNNTKSVLNKVI